MGIAAGRRVLGPAPSRRRGVRSPALREGLGEGLRSARRPRPPPLPEGGEPTPRSAVAFASFVALLVVVSPAGAQDQDGAYGRLEGDLTFDLALGGGATFEGDLVSGASTLEARARYLDGAGLMLGGEVRPEGASRLLIMADVRPIFLARFLLGGSLRDRWLDLVIDSIGIDVGVALVPLDERVGAALAVGFGLDLPLVFFGEGVEGLALRLYGRHVASLATDRLGPDAPQNDWIAGGAIVLRLQARAGIASWEPRRYELRAEDD